MAGSTAHPRSLSANGHTPPAAAPARVVVDADACVPEALRDALGIATAPAEAPVLLERASILGLAADAGVVAVEAIAAACAAAAEAGGDVVYVRATDGYASPDEAEAAARAAVEARGARLHVLASGASLMAAGWAAVRVAEALRDGAALEAALEAGRAAAAGARAIAMLEHPELAGLAAPSSGGAPGAPRGSTWRVLVRVEGAALPLLAAAPARDIALGLLRDRFAALVRAEEEAEARREAAPGALRIAFHHAGASAAAEALATWSRRHLSPSEVRIAPLTRHAASRLGPGMVGVAWLREAGG